jgi:hypothetical protein
MSAHPKHVLAPSLQRLQNAFVARGTSGELHALQSAAFERFIAKGFPTQRDEAWHYTNLRRLETRNFQAAVAQPAAIDSSRLPDFDAARLVFVNGVYNAALSQTSCDGLRVRTWNVASAADVHLTREIFGEPAGTQASSFRDLNTARDPCTYSMCGPKVPRK